jgi:hypothetical protein
MSDFSLQLTGDAPHGGRASTESPDERATTFQAVQGPQAEHYSGEVLLVSAYAILWVLLLAWVAMIWRKESAVSVRVRELEKVLDRAASERESGRTD